MAIGTKICKVCGKEYEACHTLRPNLNNEFRWQDVACCEEHGQEYLRMVMAARGHAPKAEAKPERKAFRKRKTEPADAVIAQEPEKGEVA